MVLLSSGHQNILADDAWHVEPFRAGDTVLHVLAAKQHWLLHEVQKLSVYPEGTRKMILCRGCIA